jgi:hypothetical protein
MKMIDSDVCNIYIAVYLQQYVKRLPFTQQKYIKKNRLDLRKGFFSASSTPQNLIPCSSLGHLLMQSSPWIRMTIIKMQGLN